MFQTNREVKEGQIPDNINPRTIFTIMRRNNLEKLQKITTLHQIVKQKMPLCNFKNIIIMPPKIRASLLCRINIAI
jgi:hypothetical protein